MKRTFLLILAILMGLTSIFAVDEKSVKSVPIDEAIDVCEWCHMAVKNNGYASELILDGGKTVKFDDIGCLFRYKAKNTGEKIIGEFVQDAYSKELVALNKTYFVDAKSIPTPMSSGIHSFKTKENALKFIKEKKTGSIIELKDLESRNWKEMKKM
jgi:copper chaperone NosL